MLFIDDEPALLGITKDWLETEGSFKVETTDSGAEGLTLLRSSRFDAIVSDYMMPGMNGIALLKNIRAEAMNIPFILFTGRGRGEVVIEALNNGADGYLQKGGEPRSLYAELTHKICVAVNKQRAEAALEESEQRYRLLFEKAPIGYQSLDADRKFILVNDAWLKILGYKADEVIGRSFEDFLAPEYRQKFRTSFTKFIEAGEIMGVEFQMICKDGSNILASFNGKIGYNEQGDFKQTHCIIIDITESRKYEEALRESEGRYRSVVENASEGITVVQDGVLKYVNPRALVMMQISTDEFVNRPIDDFIHPDDKEMVLDRYRRRVQGEESPSRYDFRMVGDRSGIVWVSLSTVLIQWEGRSATLNFLVDITEHKQAEEALQKERDQVQMYLDIAGVMLLVLDTDGTIVLINKKGCEILGYEEQELVGKNWFDLCLPQTIKQDLKGVLNRIVTGDDAVNEYYENAVLTKKGEERLIAFHNAVLFDRSSGTFGIFSSGEDITERKRAEEGLRESEEKLRTVFESLTDGVTVTDLNGKIIQLNQATVLLHSYDRKEELIGRSAFELIAEKDRPKAMHYLQETLRTGKSGTIEYVLLKKDGSEFEGDLRAALLKDDDGNSVGFIAITNDITERKIAEKTLLQANKKLNILSSITRHDTLNNIMAIKGYATLLKDKGLDPEQEQYVRKMLSSINTIQRQMEFTKLYQGIGVQAPV